MALIKCPECGREISNKAKACPGCGYEVRNLNVRNYGTELGRGVKEGMKGLNTIASPKKKKTCLILSCMPFITVIFAMIGGLTENDFFIGITLIPALMCGACQFYIGNFKKGLIYTFTVGLFLIGALIDIFKITVTGTFRDANGFPVIY